MMSSTNTPQVSLQQFIDQRLDAIDQALLGILSRPERLAAVAQVELQMRERAAANAMSTGHPSEPGQGLNSPLAAFTAADGQLPLFQPQTLGLPAGVCGPAAKKKCSRLAISAAVMGIVAFGLMCLSPLTYFVVGILNEALGEFFSYGLLGAHVLAVAICGFVAVGLGVIALFSLRRHKGLLDGHGWAITGLCTGPVPMLVGGLAILVVGLQLGLGEFVTTSFSTTVTVPNDASRVPSEFPTQILPPDPAGYFPGHVVQTAVAPHPDARSVQANHEWPASLTHGDALDWNDVGVSPTVPPMGVPQTAAAPGSVSPQPGGTLPPKELLPAPHPEPPSELVTNGDLERQ
jgi:hypothetical protein